MNRRQVLLLAVNGVASTAALFCATAAAGVPTPWGATAVSHVLQRAHGFTPVAAAACASIRSAPSRHAAQPANPATSLAGQIDVPRLLDLSAQRLKLNIEYDANALKAAGQVTLRLDAGLTDAELWDLTNRILVARGFATVRVPGRAAYAVVKLADAPGLATASELPAGEPAGGEPAAGERPPGEPAAGFRSAILRAKHRPGKELTEAAAKVLSKTGSTAVVLKEGPEGALILLSDTSARLDQALNLIALIDVPATQVQVEDVPVRNYSSQQLATLVAQVGAKRELVSGEKIPGDVIPSPDGGSVLIIADARHAAYWRALVASLDTRDRLETVTYSPRVFGVKEVAKLIEAAVRSSSIGADDRWKLVTDELTGSLIITATPAQHEQIVSLVERLDSTLSPARRPVRSFKIRNRSVREIQSILDQLVQTGVLASDGPATDGRPLAASDAPLSTWPPAASSAAGPAPNPSLAAHPQAHLQVRPQASPQAQPPFSSGSPTAERDAHRAGAELILSIDEGTNTLIAMGEPRLLSQVESLLQSLDVRQAQVMLEVLIVSLSDSQTLDLGVEIEALGSTDDVRTRIASLFGLGTRDSAGNRTAGDGLGLTGVILNPGDFSIILRALQTLNRGRSLSMPRLLVTNNQQATLDSVLEQPFASTNASNTVTTTSFGGSKPAGTQITLKPQIAEGDHLLLDYNISLSAFVGAAASAAVPPPRQENRVQSAAALPDGHTVVVGGIELLTEGKAVNQVPGLARVPWLGELFKNRSSTNSRSRFFVFIRANILRHGSFEDLKYLGEVAAGQAGIDDGWPVVEPRVIR